MARPRTNVSPLPTSFVGRADALAALAAEVRPGRAVTILGPPGTGKTRLARRFAELALERDPPKGGVWFCDLTEATAVQAVEAALVGALGLEAAGARGDRLAAALHARGPLLLVLDNFEQIVSAAPDTVAAWLAGAPQAAILVTSRQRLAVAGEVVFDLGPLSIEEEGFTLFVERARAVDHGFVATADARAAILELVRRLDGLPLAIELAAARARVLSPAQILARLPRHFELLGPDPGSVRPVRGTLWEAIDASYALLAPAERDALAACSVFRGATSIEAVEAVVDLSHHADAPWALDALQTLRDRSLVTVHTVDAGPEERRYSLLVSIREYAAKKLAESGRERAALLAHARHYLTTGAPRADAATRGDEAARRRLLIDRDNLVAVHQRALEASTKERGADALEAAVTLAAVASSIGNEACLALLDAGLAACPEPPPGLAARALAARGDVRRFLGRIDESAADFEAARAIAERAGDDGLVARALLGLGNALTVRARWAEARAPFERALALLRAKGDTRTEGRVATLVGATLFNEDRLDDARAMLERAVAVERAAGDLRFAAMSTTSLGIVALFAGDRRAARAALDEALAAHTRADDRHWIGVTRTYLALLAQDEGRLDDARALYAEALTLLRQVGVRRAEGIALFYAATCRLEAGDFAGARADFEDALVIHRVTSPDYEGLIIGCLGAIAAAAGRVSDARARFAEAEAALKPFERPSFVAALELHRASLDFALARAGGLVRADAAQAVKGRLAAAGKAKASADLRIAARLARAALTELSAPDAAASLVVAEGGLTFRLRGGPEVGLHRRRAMQLVLEALARRRLDAPGEAVSIRDLVAAGWPGERVLASAGADRVYSAILALRKLGLRDLLQRKDDGYLLDPAMPLTRPPRRGKR